MPYIKSHKRYDFDEVLDQLPVPSGPGELNYLFTKIALKFLKRFDPPAYDDFNDVIGALEGAKLELYRRHVVPYEDIKIRMNGDVIA
jgi:hypothetical protein